VSLLLCEDAFLALVFGAKIEFLLREQDSESVENLNDLKLF